MKKAMALSLFAFLASSCMGSSAASGPCNKPLPELFHQVSPAVVFISAISLEPSKLSNRLNVAIGSGFIFGDEGLVLTNSHVVFGRQAISVTLDDGRRFPATLLGADPIYDLAILKIPEAPANVPKAVLGDSSKIQIGEAIIAIGNPLGLEQTLTRGVISGVNRVMQESQMPLKPPLIQTDAAINPGNSGGPLLNLCGEVIGINTATMSEAQNIGFAIPINLARRTIPELVKEGRVIRPWIGVIGTHIEKDALAIFNLPITEGFLVETVEPGSPAQKMGLRGGELPVMVGSLEILLGGDIITRVNETALDSPERILEVYRFLRVGEKIRITYSRMGEKKEAEFVIPERPILPHDLLSGGAAGLTPQSRDPRPSAPSDRRGRF